MSDPDPRLLEWCALPGPARVMLAARARLEAGHSLRSGSLAVDLDREERREVGKLLGLEWENSGRGVPALRLARVLEERADIEDLLVQLHGQPLVRRSDLRREAALRQDSARRQVEQELLAAGAPHDRVTGFLDQRGLARENELITLGSDLLRVLRALPEPHEPVLLQVLATRALDDPHALDWKRPLSRHVLRLVGDREPGNRAEWTEAWEEIGVVCDELSSRVLVHNLLLNGDAPACALTRAAFGEPVWLTYRSLSRGSFAQAGDGDVWVCENPSVVLEAVRHLGQDCAPLVCVNGNPTRAAMLLVTGLAGAGSGGVGQREGDGPPTGGERLRISADDDPAGQRIVSRIREAAPRARLWRFTVRAPGDRWDPGYEEHRMEDMLADLRTGLAGQDG